MKIDREKLQEIVQSSYAPMILQEHGADAIPILKNLFAQIRTIYRFFSPEYCRERITILQRIDASNIQIIDGAPIIVRDTRNLPGLCTAPFTIQILDTGGLLLWNGVRPDPGDLSNSALVYVFEGDREFIYAKGKSRQLEKFHHSHASCFSIPTFYVLSEALEYYKSSMVRHSSCEILKEIWFDQNRLFLKRAQEVIMRKSLTQYLKVCLRGDCEVRPEQVVDETHPVDIKITWQIANRLALIEIKWLGTPRDLNGIGTPYTDYRALEGAKQLADYLDANKTQAPLHTTRGYLVVIDARRKALGTKAVSISCADGKYYVNKEITYNPEYHKIRDDFEMPIRMFAEPICT